MPVGTSNPDQPYYEDGYAQAVDAHQTSARAEGRPVVYITKPDVEDRRDETYTLRQQWNDGVVGTDIMNRLRGHAPADPESPAAASPSTPLAAELGRDNIKAGPDRWAPLAETVGGFIQDEYHQVKRLGGQMWDALHDPGMPLGPSTEPAGALKPEGGTQTPGKGSQQESKVRFTTASPLINITDEDIETGMNVAMSVGPGTMAGVKSKLVDRTALGHANILEGNAEHPDQILKKTGFFRGADGRWRYEIDDSKASFDRQWVDSAYKASKRPMSDSIAALPTILNHPELYKAYPELKGILVRHSPIAETSHWDKANNEIVIAKQHLENQGVLMHEVQHAIQDIEGFAKGGSPGVAGEDFMLKYAPAMRNLEPEMAALVAKKDSGKALTKAEEARAAWLTKVAKKYLEYHKAGNEEAMRYYMRLTGETEARNVDTRLLMTEAERRKLHPSHTENVAAPHQISVDEPVGTTAYGVTDPKTGRLMKSVEPTHFRRAANDNISDEGYRKKVAQWEREDAEATARVKDLIKKEDDLRSKRMDLINKHQKGGWNEVDLARFNKWGKEIADLYGDNYEPVKF